MKIISIIDIKEVSHKLKLNLSRFSVIKKEIHFKKLKKAIIIGGTSGIGQGLATILLTNNYKVGLTGTKKNIIKDLQNLGQKNLEVKYLNCLTDNISERITELVKILGGLDLLIFSAGIGNLNNNLGFEVENNANKLNVLAFTEIADWSYRFFEKQSHGHFVAITSISGLFGCRISPAYHAAKSYQINYLEALRQKARRARKTGKSIYVTDIRPGFVDTPMTKGKKMFWVATKDKAAKQIFELIKKKRGYGYVTNRWRIVAVIIKILPTWIRNRL
jgi:short-subunit dehydrogenase